MTIENAGADLAGVQGLVTVQLADADTGRVLHRETRDNFLSVQSLAVARWWQRLMWGAYNPVETLDTAGTMPSELPWFPAQHLGYWDDATAESSGTEDSVAKDLVGWASRHPVGSPSGKRGVVNITESAFSDASAKWVMDWTTSQGNGTFQSVGWTRVDETSGFLVPRYPEDDAVTFTNAGATASSSGRPLWYDGALWNSCEWVSATTQYRVVSFPAAGGVSTSIVLLPSTAWRDDVAGTGRIFGLARIGTDIITCGQTGTGPKLMRHTVAASQTWTRTETTLSATTYRDCTIDGSSNIWTAGSDGVVRRHSNVDGTISATFTPVLAPTALTGIAYDAADGNLWVIGTVAGRTGQLWKIDTSGNTVGPLWSLSASVLTVTSSSPFAGNYNVPIAGAREPYQLTHYRTGTLTGVDLARPATRNAATTAWAATGVQTALAVKSGVVWASAGSTTVGGATVAAPVRGGTLGTRTKLASPITKTNTQTLKITYQFNFS